MGEPRSEEETPTERTDVPDWVTEDGAEVYVCTLFQTPAQRLGIKPKGKR